MTSNDMTPLQAQEESPYHRPGRRPSGPAGADPRRNHAANAPAVTWVGDTTLHPDTAKGFASSGHGHGTASGKKDHRPHPWPVTRRTGLISEAPAHGNQGLPAGPGAPHSVPTPTEDPSTTPDRVRETRGRPRDPPRQWEGPVSATHNTAADPYQRHPENKDP
mgnify:CR=1 FL=1